MTKKNNETYQVLKKISQEKYEPELVLFQNAPGSGKSHSVASVIAEDMMDSDSEQIWVYLTTDKKNRDNEYHRILSLAPQCKKNIMLLKSNQDFLLDYFAKLTKKAGIANDDPIKERDFILKNFLSQISDQTCSSTHTLLNDIINRFYLVKLSEKDIRKNEGLNNSSIKLDKDLEREFNKISYAMSRDFDNRLSHLRRLRKKENKPTRFTLQEKQAIFAELFPWYRDAFPGLAIKDNYRCIVMTAQKYFYPIKTIHNQSQTILDLLKKKNVNLILDEADQIKKIWLDEIIDLIAPKNGENYLREDLFVVFRRILQSLNTTTNQLPTDLINDKQSKKVLRLIKKRFTALCRKYHLNCNVQLDSELDDDTSHFIFNYGQDNVTINVDHQNEQLSFEYDPKRRLNIIKNYDSKKEKNIPSLNKVLQEVRGAISFFMLEISQLASKFHQWKDDQNTILKYQKYTLLDHEDEELYILRTLIQGSSEENHLHEYLLKTFLERKHSKQLSDLRTIFSTDNTMFNKGFSYFNIVSYSDKEAMSHVYLFSQQKTPEKMLAQAANNWRVFMISATVDNKSALSNFAYSWLETNVPKIRRLTHHENQLLNNANNCRIKLYRDKVETKVEEITADYTEGTVEAVFNNWLKQWIDTPIKPKTIQELLRDYAQIDPSCNGTNTIAEWKEGAFTFLRHLKAISAIIRMCRLHQQDATQQSFVIYRNAKTSDEILDWFKAILRAVNLVDYQDSLIPLEANNKNQNLKDVKKAWEDGKFRIFLTTFATLDRGANLQYEICPEFWQKKRKNYVELQQQFVNEQHPVKDLDGIYIEKPTHLFTSSNEEELTANDILHLIFEQDELFNVGEISYAEKETRIEHYFNDKGYISMSDLPSVQIAGLVRIEQALGRISRVEIKNKTQHVYLDDSAISLFQKFDRNKRINGLMSAVLTKMPALTPDINETAKQERRKLNQCSNKMLFMVDIAHHLQGCSKEKQEMWVHFRDLVLRYPFLDSWKSIKNDRDRQLLTFCYWEFAKQINHYYYIQHNDYSYLEKMSLKKNDDKMKLLDYSYYDQALKRIFKKNPWIKDQLKAEGYAVDLSGQHKYLLTPGIFNNFYKAAISEKIFIMVAEHFGLDVHPMEELSQDEFEKMDGYLASTTGRILYYDMKNYDDTKSDQYETKADFLKKEQEKLAEMIGNSAVIINFYNWSGKNYAADRLPKEFINGAVYIYPCLFKHNGEINQIVIDDLSIACSGGKK